MGQVNKSTHVALRHVYRVYSLAHSLALDPQMLGNCKMCPYLTRRMWFYHTVYLTWKDGPESDKVEICIVVEQPN